MNLGNLSRSYNTPNYTSLSLPQALIRIDYPKDPHESLNSAEIYAKKSLLMRKEVPSYIKKEREKIEMRLSRYRQQIETLN